MANPNPELHPENLIAPWQKGQSGNPGGIPKHVKAMHMRAAELAAEIRLRKLEQMAALEGVTELDATEAKLLVDAENRAFGQPKAEVEQTGTTEIVFKTVYEDKP